MASAGSADPPVTREAKASRVTRASLDPWGVALRIGQSTDTGNSSFERGLRGLGVGGGDLLSLPTWTRVTTSAFAEIASETPDGKASQTLPFSLLLELFLTTISTVRLFCWVVSLSPLERILRSKRQVKQKPRWDEDCG